MSEQPVIQKRIHSSLSEILTYQRLLRRQGPAQGSNQNLSDRLNEVRKTIDAAREKGRQNSQKIRERIKREV